MSESKDPEQDDTDEAHKAHWAAVEEATELLNEERYHDALTALKTVLETDPTNGYAFFYTGVALYECGEIAAARDGYLACLKLYPRHLGARIALSHVERALGNTREAIKVGLIALEQAPGDGDALHAVGLAYHARGEHVPARRYLTAFLETNPEFEVRCEVEALLNQPQN
jgi:tetratricopeptide (TPR) repeat protein